MDEQVVTSASGEYTRRVWSQEGHGPLRIFLDAELYLNRVDVLPLVAGQACLFVSNLDAEARHHDYTCNPRYAEFIAKDVARGEEGVLICGLSLSGLAAAHMALLYPSVFPYAICQSGSFWWNSEWFSANAPPALGRFWLSVGDQEQDFGISHPPTELRQDITQIAGVQRAAEALRKRGADVKYQPYSGGHDPARWREELPQAMMWILGPNP